MSNGNTISELSASPPSRSAQVGATRLASKPDSPTRGRHRAGVSNPAGLNSASSSTFHPPSTAETSGAVSPVTIDSRSRRGSFNKLRKQSPAPRKSNIFTTQQQAAQQSQHAKEMLRNFESEELALRAKLQSLPQTRSAPTTNPTPADPPKEEVEVISMSPVVSDSTQSYTRSQTNVTINSPLSHPVSSDIRPARRPSTTPSPATYKPTGGEAHFYEVEKCKVEDKPYFGQVVNSFDLVANNIEKAVEAMR